MPDSQPSHESPSPVISWNLPYGYKRTYTPRALDFSSAATDDETTVERVPVAGISTDNADETTLEKEEELFDALTANDYATNPDKEEKLFDPSAFNGYATTVDHEENAFDNLTDNDCATTVEEEEEKNSKNDKNPYKWHVFAKRMRELNIRQENDETQGEQERKKLRLETTKENRKNREPKKYENDEENKNFTNHKRKRATLTNDLRPENYLGKSFRF